MKCLSLWQPWASLIAIGAKTIETRGWATNYRGPLAIHAAKTWNRELAHRATTDPHCEALTRGGVSISLWKAGDGLPKGCIVAVVELVDVVLCDCVVRLYGRGRLSYQERAFGDYGPGRFAWMLGNLRRLAKPVPFKGHQGLFNVPDELLVVPEGNLCPSCGDPKHAGKVSCARCGCLFKVAGA